jgi:hypothetical protein
MIRRLANLPHGVDSGKKDFDKATGWEHTAEFSPIAFSEMMQTEGTDSSGFFLENEPPFTTLKKSTYISKML